MPRTHSAVFSRMRFLLLSSLFMLIGMDGRAAQDMESQQRAAYTYPAYTFKARNLKPADFGFEDRNWDAVLRHMNGRLDEHPDDSDLLFERAIAYREYGVRRALVLRNRDWKRSRQDFESLLQRDSSFNDVLYQYAILKRYDGEFDEARMLLQRQIALKPATSHAIVALFRLYQQVLHEADSTAAEAFIATLDQETVNFLHAMQARKTGRLRDADELLGMLIRNALLKKTPVNNASVKRSRLLPLQPVLLARARTYYAMDEPAIAESFVKQAIASISNETAAWLVLEDFKHILDDAEVAAFFEIDTPEGWQSFFLALLRKRNPVRSERVDRRLAQHYRRLIEAEEKYAFYESREAYRVVNNVNKDRMADGDFPQAYWLNGEFGDKGLVFIRHGDPVDIVGSVTPGTPFIESWRYRVPALDFHFEGHGSLAELIPTLPVEADVLEARENWGGVYVRLASAARIKRDGGSFGRRRQNEMDLITYGNELLDESLDDVHAGLTTDRHQWDKSTRPLTVPHFIAAFQGDSSRVPAENTLMFEQDENPTDVEVYFSVPIGLLSRALKDRERLGIEVGLAVHDRDWNEIYASFETLDVKSNNSLDAIAVDYIHFKALPDSYHVNLHVKIADTAWIGSYQFDYAVPDFESEGETPRLMISDVVPAVEITPIDRTSRYAKNGLYLRTNPGRGYRTTDPFFIYFEIYNLTFGSDDLTHFDVTYILQEPEGAKRGLFKRRKSEPLLSVTYELEGESLNQVEYGEIDMAAVPAGVYELKVVVTDRNSGLETSNSRVIELK